MKIFAFFLLLIASLSIVCANAVTFDSIKQKLSQADSDAKRFASLANANPVTANGAAQIVSALLSTHIEFIDATGQIYTFQGNVTSAQVYSIITILNSLQISFNTGIPHLVNNKAAIVAAGRAEDVADRLAALDGSAGALVAGLKTIVPESLKQQVSDVAGNIGTNAFNGCNAFDGKAC